MQQKELKQNGVNIQLDQELKLSEEKARKLNPDYFFVMPYGFIKEFIKREEKWLKTGGKFILPYPNFKVLR